MVSSLRWCLTVIIIYTFIEKSSAQFQYISPVPGSIYHNPSTNIILKNGNLIDSLSLTPGLFTVVGSVSGVHSIRVTLSDDQQTIVAYPATYFADSETVNVSVATGIKTSTGLVLRDTAFQFQTHPDYYFNRGYGKRSYDLDGEIPHKAYLPVDTRTDSSEIPLPQFLITDNGNEYPSRVFYYNFKSSGEQDTTDDYQFKTILNDNGDSVYASYDNNTGIDFKLNNNGYLTFFNGYDSSFQMMDSSYHLIDSFFAGNGYYADGHDFQIFPDGHSYLLAYDEQIIDMSKVVNNGIDTAHVTGLILQELDKKKQVVFEWRSWDHFDIRDSYELLHNHADIDLVHGNSIELEQDGNILLSSRHLSEVTKINHATGETIWRFGGKNNQFAFINDPDSIPFYYQHDARQLANGHITLFNNNKQEGIPASVKEYALDEINKTAMLVWSYVHPSLDSGAIIISNAMGNAQRLPNGNTFICWGYFIKTAQVSYPNFTEVDSLGNIVWEFRFTGNENYISYRAFKFDWKPCGLPVPASLVVNSVTYNSAGLSWAVPSFASNYEVDYKESAAADWIVLTTFNNSYLLTSLVPETQYDWRVKTICTAMSDSSDYTPVEHFNTLSTGISSPLSEKFSFFPNPTKEVLNLDYILNKNSPVNCFIINMLGEIVFNKAWHETEGHHLSIITLPYLNKGIYLIGFKTEGQEFYKKVIIQ
ncbi:MAG: aryl-sulfate sulfotransferase [Chitinophagales bacterium]|nr:aryl-sulfate sulfotransferase [Chitinophagales bacterium]